MITPPRKLIVAALAVADDGKILLTRRPPGKPLADFWELPGGKVEPGEAPTMALQRELREELGCESTVGRIEEVLHHAYDGFEVVILVYRVTLHAAPQAIEVAEVRWVEAKDLSSLPILPADAPLVARLQADAGRER